MIAFHNTVIAHFQLARSIVCQHLETVPENLSDASVSCTDLQAVTKSWVGEVRQLANVKRDATLILSTLERLSHNPRFDLDFF